MGQDPNNQFLPETIGAIVMNRTAMDLFNVHYEALYNSVGTGVGENSSSTLPISGFSQAPSIVIAGMNGLNFDNKGYWPVIHNDDPFSAAGVKMNVDIDRYSDPTRAHASSEYVSAYVFGVPIVYSGRTGANNAPIFNYSMLYLYYPVALPISASLTNYATDPDGDTMSFVKNSGPAWLSIASDGTLSGTPDMSNLGDNSFSVTASDGAKSTLVQLIVSVTMGDMPIFVTTDTDDDDCTTAQTTYDLGPTDLAGAWSDLNDSDGMSLREALWFAAKAVGTNSILFDTYADTWTDSIITLTNGTRLVIDSPVVIDGCSGVTIDANHGSRVMYVNDGNGDGANTVVTLKNLTITGGDGDKSTSSANGAGINNAEILTLESCNVVRNRFIGGNGNWQQGIGINNDGDLTVLNSRITHNTSALLRSRGGGINTGGKTLIINSVIANNSLSGGSRTAGGGIRLTGSTLTIVNSSIYDNACGSGDGCGIKKDGGTLIDIYSSVVAGNKQGSAIKNNIRGGAALTCSLAADDITFDGSTWINGGNNITGTNFFDQVYDGADTNSGTDVGAVIYSDGGSYDTTDNGGTYARLTPCVDVREYVRESGSGIDMGAYEIQILESGESYYNVWATNAGLSGASAAYDEDSDGDGLNNFLEYVYGGDPSSSVGAYDLRPKLELVDQGDTHNRLEYTFRFRRDAALRQLSYTADNSLALGAGASWTTCTNIMVKPINADFDKVTVCLPASTNSGFVKVKCIATP